MIFPGTSSRWTEDIRFADEWVLELFDPRIFGAVAVLGEVTKNAWGFYLRPLTISRIDKMPTPHHRKNAALPYGICHPFFEITTMGHH